MKTTQVDLIRHGEPVGGRRYRGNGADDPLSETGWRQMWTAVGDQASWDQIISSPMQRCFAFARELASRHALPLAVEPGFMEVGLGAWEGRSHAEVAATEPDAVAAFHRDPVGHRPPGAEPLEVFLNRITAAYARQTMTYPGRRLLIVCHAGVTRALIGHALAADPSAWYRLRVDYAGLSRVCTDDLGPRVEFVNRRRLP
ncbi:histidine phosphatase family protein [Thiorhodococcus mannitoliphagus]|uniref:Histidine phosphatase family protein n=1 Tax=Thiorhodococcus mannitoliphagus TaxID=329406 RepID=A0A6P1DSH4_9GAMM|nr:histidine phosphatase family protein [Thiorhodococcus mannitoliphagus]NEX20500.1 histidine phosphatase family protein [Thiorhodococcus mannitoliphagus]